jgi:endonuclease/exonuclease/phosphatase family metal-dependent hydrolase
MAYYKNLKGYEPEKAAWISERLINLRETIRASDLGRRNHNNLVIGSWNIRAFDDGKPRRDESYHYIAEIIDHFDICAVQEIKRDLAPLRRLLKLLGPNWDYFVTDVTEGNKGNKERQAFLYNKQKVFFRNLVGEIVLGRDALIDGEQIARTPYFASFQAGWFRFTLCSVHILFGKDKTLRKREISAIAERLVERSKDEGEVYVLIGDMNIEKRNDEIFKALTDHNMTVPLFGATNLGGTKFYDQIAFTSDEVRTNFVNSGTVDWRKDVFGKDDKDHYETLIQAERVEEGKEPYGNWDTAYQNFFASFEMSDHLPIWIEIKTDYSDDYLGKFLNT